MSSISHNYMDHYYITITTYLYTQSNRIYILGISISHHSQYCITLITFVLIFISMRNLNINLKTIYLWIYIHMYYLDIYITFTNSYYIFNLMSNKNIKIHTHHILYNYMVIYISHYSSMLNISNNTIIIYYSSIIYSH